ncbi:Ig-like domain-containing protein, partial [Undibacterium sp. TC9W]|uniref:Ig-like domain-containing protein n=1 Tax=Undibacterium sp. TC9W TaxID=3413053 RepID=UPI003BEFE1D5
MNLLDQTTATDIQSVHEDALANSTVAHLMATLSTPAPSLSLGTAANPSAGQQILIIDGRVPDQATLINASKEGVKVIVLDTEHDGVQQIADALKDVHNASSISIISHGDDGVLLLGNSPLHNGNVANYTEQLKAIGASLQTGGEIRLYGCDIGKDSVGQDFIQSIAQVTGATVEASTDATGTASRGGNWDLEISTGTLPKDSALDTSKLGNYDHLLVTTAVNSINSLKSAIATGNSDGFDDIITFTGNITFSNASDSVPINVTDGHTMTIVGGGNTLNGNNMARVMTVGTNGAGSAVVIQNLTITNGFVTGNGGNAGVNGPDLNDVGKPGDDAKGAGIWNSGVLTISNSTITNNKASAGGGAGGLTSGNGGGGGGGGGYGSSNGGNGGSSLAYSHPGATGTAGTGGNGGPLSGQYFLLGGKGGTTTGGNGSGGFATYSRGGNGGTANAGGGLSIGGGGGGGGADAKGGAGGNAVGGIYNIGTLTISGSSITNNIGAGGGGGGGSKSDIGKDGGAGGNGVGGIWNNGGTVTLDSATNNSLATGNRAGAGNGGYADSGSSPGADGIAYDQKLGTFTVLNNPTITNVTSSKLNGSYPVGTVIQIQITFSEAVIVTGTPQLLLETGVTDRTINYISGSTSSTLTFTYTVQAGDTNADLDYNSTTALSLNGGTIKSASSGSDATLTLFSPGAANSLGANKNIVIDTTAPAAPSAPDMTAGTDNGVSNTDNLTSSTTPVFTGTAEAGSTITLYDTDGTTVLGTATATGGSYSITSSTLSAGGHTLTAKATDAAGNVSDASTGLAVTIDTTAPTVNSVSVPVTATYIVGQNLDFTLNLSENVTVTGSPKLDLTLDTGGTVAATYLSGSGTSALVFRYTVVNGNLDTNGVSLGANIALNGGTLKDTAGNDATLTLNSVGALSNVLVDGVVPTISSINRTGAAITNATSVSYTVTFSESVTGVDTSDFVLTPTGGVNGNITSVTGSGTTYTVTVNGISGDGTLRLDLKNAGTGIADVASNAIATGYTGGQVYTLDNTAPTTTVATAAMSADTGTSNTDFITKTAAQTISGTLSANMVANEFVEVSIDNGSTWTSATTTVGQNTWSLSGVTLTASSTLKVRVSDAAGNIGTAFSQAYVLDTTAPTTTIATATFSADTGTSSTDFITKTAAQTISGTLTANMVAGDIVEVSLDNGSTWTSATTTVGQSTWSLSGVTLTASSTLQVRVSDTAGNSSAPLSQAYVLDTTAPTTTIATASLSADTGTSNTDFITKTAAQTLSGTLSTNMVANEFVEVSIDNGSTWTSATTTVGQSTWSLSGVTLTGSSTLKVRVSDAAGNSGTAFSRAYVLDTTPPTTTIATASFSADTGTSSTDFITKTAAQTISGTLSANMVAGEIVEVSLDNGSTWTSATTTVGMNTWSLSGVTLTTSSTLKVRVSDVAGNSGTAFSQAYVLDTTAPTTTIATATFSADTGTSGTDFITKTAAQTISGTLSSNMVTGDIVEVSLDNGSTWTNATTTVGQSTWSLSGTTLSASSTLKVRVTDNAGNSGLTFSQAYVLDTTAPAAPSTPDMTAATDTGVSNTDNITANTTPIFTGTAEANSTVKLYDTDGVTLLGTNTADGAGNWSITSSALAVGSHFIKATATDAAGNIGVLSTGLAITIATPTITSASYDAATGILTVTGTGMVTNDTIDVSKLTLSGENGDSYTLTAATPNPTAGSATSFIVTLGTADKLAINGLLNNNGASAVSGTTFNLTGALNWDSTAGAAADATNAVTVSNVAAPTITSATYDVTTHILTVTGTGLVSTLGATNDITVSALTIKGEGGV